MLPVRCRDARLAFCGLRASAQSAVQKTAPVALMRRPLARGAVAGLCTAPLAGPIRAMAPGNTLLKFAICYAEISTSYRVSLYPIIGGAARVG